ncbi:MAG TPA: recombinase RecT [Mesorhizobium sp.]|nr:recombinase RecT [Mesorhizobium sp.]
MTSIGLAHSAGGTSLAPQNLAEVVKFAEVMSRAGIALPKHLRGNPGACMAVSLQAMQWEMNPFAVAAKSYSVNDLIAYEAQLIAAVVNTRSGIKGRLRYEFSGEGNELWCKVTGNLDGQDYAYESPMVGAIHPKNSPLWKSDPRQQLGYYSARAWARRYTPEVILGVYDRDEAAEFGPDRARDVTPTVLTRLQSRQDAPGAQEGFSAAHVTRETELLTSGPETGQDEPKEDEPSSVFQQPASRINEPEADGDLFGGGEGPAAPEDGDGGSEQASAASSSPTLSDAERTWLARVATALCAVTAADGETGPIEDQAKIVAKEAPKPLSTLAKEKASSIKRQCFAVAEQEVEKGDAAAHIAGIAGIEASAVRWLS